jgi:hypothetical protein
MKKKKKKNRTEWSFRKKTDEKKMLKKQIFTETWKEKKEEYLCKSEIINHSFD